MASGMHARPEGLLPASPPRRSLLDVPGVRVSPQVLASVPWEQGIAVQPESCDVTIPAEFADLAGGTTDYPYWWEVCSASDTAPETAIPSGVKAVGAGAANVVAEAFTIWRGYRCSALDVRGGARLAEVEARVRRALEACTPAAVEHELWTGDVANAAGFDTPALQDLGPAGEVAGGTPLGYVTALAELEQRMAECYCSGEHIIHAQPRTVTAWAAEGLVQVTPDRTHLETLKGTYVVAGVGYPGTDPNASGGIGSGLSYAYGSGMVRVFLGAPQPPSLGAPEVQAADHTMVNTVTLRAERSALVIFDACCHAGVAVNLCDRLCGAAS